MQHHRTSSGKEQDEVRMEDPGNRTGRLEQSTSQWGSQTQHPKDGWRRCCMVAGCWAETWPASLPGWVSTESAPTFPNSRQLRHPNEIEKEKEKS